MTFKHDVHLEEYESDPDSEPALPACVKSMPIAATTDDDMKID